jgi:hypothetical protein
MGLFTKTIPKRRWMDVSAALHNSTKSYRASWFQRFTAHVVPLDIGLRSRELTPEIEDAITLLQFAVAATTIRENGYVNLQDFDFFVDLICISITSRKMVELDNRPFFELLTEPDPRIATQKGALMLLPLVAGTGSNQKLERALAEWATLLVVQSKIQTCEACFDHKTAAAVRAVFK